MPDLGFGNPFQPQGWQTGQQNGPFQPQQQPSDQQRQWAWLQPNQAAQEQARKEAEAKQGRDFLRGMTSPTASMDATRQQSLRAMDTMFGRSIR